MEAASRAFEASSARQLARVSIQGSRGQHVGKSEP